MRNLRRLAAEIRILERIVGKLHYPVDGSWVKICHYKLPQHKYIYNLKFVTILIIIPSQYDSVGVYECYIDKDLKIRKGSIFGSLPHTEPQKYDNQGYRWLCFHSSSSFVSLLAFINTLKLYFTDPFKYQNL